MFWYFLPTRLLSSYRLVGLSQTFFPLEQSVIGKLTINFLPESSQFLGGEMTLNLFSSGVVIREESVDLLGEVDMPEFRDDILQDGGEGQLSIEEKDGPQSILTRLR